MAEPTKGASVSSIDNFDFKTTKYENSGNDGDKGTRESSNYVASNGGWVKDTSSTHQTNQNVPKRGKGRH